jgi:hypothetical protein
MMGLVVRPEPAPKNASPSWAREMRTTLEWGFASGLWSVAVLTLGTPVMRRSPLGVMAKQNVSYRMERVIKGAWLWGGDLDYREGNQVRFFVAISNGLSHFARR